MNPKNDTSPAVIPPPAANETAPRRPARTRAALANRILNRILAEVPFYQTLPRELLTNDASNLVRRNADIVVQALRDRHAPTKTEFAERSCPIAPDMTPNHAAPSSLRQPPSSFPY